MHIASVWLPRLLLFHSVPTSQLAVYVVVF